MSFSVDRHRHRYHSSVYVGVVSLLIHAPHCYLNHYRQDRLLVPKKRFSPKKIEFFRKKNHKHKSIFKFPRCLWRSTHLMPENNLNHLAYPPRWFWAHCFAVIAKSQTFRCQQVFRFLSFSSSSFILCRFSNRMYAIPRNQYWIMTSEQWAIFSQSFFLLSYSFAYFFFFTHSSSSLFSSSTCSIAKQTVAHLLWRKRSMSPLERW